MGQPYELLVHQANREIEDGHLSPLELLNSVLNQIERTEPRLGAWVFVDIDGARKAASDLSASMVEGQLLRGIPLGFKDIYDVKGMPTAAGFSPWRDLSAERDSKVVSNLRAHGAIILGKTVTTQFAFADPVGTRNPWDSDRTPSGSSTGSGVAVAARQIPAALGTQTTGSNLRPAAYNGVVGLKPTYGLASTEGILPLAWSMDHPGILARCVEDAGLLLDAICQPPQSSAAKGRNRYQVAAREIEPVRFGIVRDFQEIAIPEVRDNVLEVARQLEQAGSSVQEISLPTNLETIKSTQWVMVLAEAAEVHRALFESHQEHYAPKMRAMMEVAIALPAWAYVRASRFRRKIRQEVDGLFDQVDCLLSPVSPELPPLCSEGTTGDYSLLAPWSLLGLPAMSVPTGLSKSKLPLAVQLAAATGEDEVVLRAAALCESLFGLMPMPPITRALSD